MTVRPRILVVDDDGPILLLMRNLLREFGFEPVSAQSGAAALEEAQKTTPDLILLDRNMPGMTGDEVLQQMRSTDELSAVPILIVSGEPIEPDEIQHGGYVRGATRGPRGERVGGVRVLASWYEPAAATVNSRALGSTRTIETVSSATGDYSLCGPRVDQVVTIRLFVADKPAGEVKATVPGASRLLMLDPVVRTGP